MFGAFYHPAMATFRRSKKPLPSGPTELERLLSFEAKWRSRIEEAERRAAETIERARREVEESSAQNTACLAVAIARIKTDVAAEEQTAISQILAHEQRAIAAFSEMPEDVFTQLVDTLSTRFLASLCGDTNDVFESSGAKR